jgi:hypothetical protein
MFEQAILMLYCGFGFAAVSFAETTFGIFDARTMAMGGAAVASANNDNAQFYNAALLAFNDEIEERTQDSRFLIPILSPQVAQSLLTVEKIARNDSAQSISLAVQNFNTAPDPLTAQAVIDTTAGLDAALADIDGQHVFADIFFGFAVSEPGKFHGAGFFMGSRLLAGGRSSITAEDRALLVAYQDGVAFIASNGAQGVEHPELFDGNGALLDPVSDFDSSISASGVLITEAAVAMSKQFQVFGRPLAASLTFKVQRIDTYDDVTRVVDGRVDTDRNADFHGNVNFDAGVATDVGQHWRFGLAIKDIIPHNYDTAGTATIRLRPRVRLGAAFHTGRLLLAIDADVVENVPLGAEDPTQDLALGAEWSFGRPFKLRAGYRYDILRHRDPIASVGVGTVWKRLAIDTAYAVGTDARAAALQFGIVF